MKKYFLIVASTIALNVFSNEVCAAPQNNDGQKDKSVYSKSDKELTKAQDDIVYDPVKKRWTRVKKLTGVEVKDKKSANDDDKLLYDDAWAFNEKKGKWEEVDVNSELYEEADDDEAAPKTFWQKLSINLSIGAGWASYINSLQGLSILKKGSDNYFQSNTQKKAKEATLVKWFYDSYSPGKLDDATATLVLGDNREKVYNGNAFEVPITLSIDYTFYDTLRLGLDFTIEGYVINKMELESTKKTKHSIENMMDGKMFLWNIRPTANIGYLFYNGDTHSWLLNMQLGPVLDKGTDGFGVSRRDGLFMSWGISWEPRINGLLTLTTRISYGFKRYKDDASFTNVPIFGNKNSNVTLWQNSLKGEVGLRIACSSNSKEDDSDEE